MTDLTLVKFSVTCYFGTPTRDMHLSKRRALRLAPETEARLNQQAQRTERSASALAEDAVADYLARIDAKRAAILAAIGEADKGVFISSQAIDQWMDSWDVEKELAPPEPDIFD